MLARDFSIQLLKITLKITFSQSLILLFHHHVFHHQNQNRYMYNYYSLLFWLIFSLQLEILLVQHEKNHLNFYLYIAFHHDIETINYLFIHVFVIKNKFFSEFMMRKLLHLLALVLLIFQLLTILLYHPVDVVEPHHNLVPKLELLGVSSYFTFKN